MGVRPVKHIGVVDGVGQGVVEAQGSKSESPPGLVLQEADVVRLLRARGVAGRR
eukprot:CAMPEP_0195121426 /NCGR_PEP_ID=MMETSP0448-20130528/124219_1 /TAXON_ID=66468 /ORGANISM="Heterocapsa triquestra, Strain CCMP 448" /LENGTH=53 /DNA_ID=CAMNT_0040158895 /DNA_START=205 /DNA_END=362 /DNA_ORIENTATION=+